MRWVDRGPAPSGVAYYARTYTYLWVQHIQQGTARPNQHNYWTAFAPDLRERFHGKCGYCERRCDRSEGPSGGRSPTVDHFRPLNDFPELAYEWTNWIFSCRQCNVECKQEKWPSSGYVDPCASEVAERPERYFDYDHDTGEIVPKGNLPQVAQDKARALRKTWGLINEICASVASAGLSGFGMNCRETICRNG